jgi:hypothetical protein
MVIARREHRTSKDIFALARDLARMAATSESTGPAATPAAKQESRGLLKRIFS